MQHEGVRMDHDKNELDKIFTVLDINISAAEDVEFCRRLGERAEHPRPLEFFTEWSKVSITLNTWMAQAWNM